MTLHTKSSAVPDTRPDPDHKRGMLAVNLSSIGKCPCNLHVSWIACVILSRSREAVPVGTVTQPSPHKPWAVLPAFPLCLLFLLSTTDTYLYQHTPPQKTTNTTDRVCTPLHYGRYPGILLSLGRLLHIEMERLGPLGIRFAYDNRLSHVCCNFGVSWPKSRHPSRSERSGGNGGMKK